MNDPSWGWSRRRVLGAGLTAPWWLTSCQPLANSVVLPAGVQGGWVGAKMDRAHAWRDGAWRKAQPTLGVRRVHTLIVGAGVAGLSAARALMQAGIDDIAVLDLEDVAGGNARGHTLHGLACPLGAHYLPMPGHHAVDVAQWLEQEGIIQWQHGRWVADERNLCHAPHERLFMPKHPGPASSADAALTRSPHAGQWQEGLLPMMGQDARTLAQYQRFAKDVADAARSGGFAMPTHAVPWTSALADLDQQSFARWLDQRGYDSPALRWMLDYVCLDDYGAGTACVSAWAGLHYFASRHGFDAPDAAERTHDAVLTWPQGNAYLTERLARPLGDRWHAGHVACSVTPSRQEVRVSTWHPATQRTHQWAAQHVVLAVPLHVALRLWDAPPAALSTIAPLMQHAPWLVSNILLKEPLLDRPGVPMAWDNVVYGSKTLGYVNARNQNLAQPAGPQLLTHYWALGGQSFADSMANRQALMQQSWADWVAQVVADLAPVHPDLSAKVQQIDLMRWGHAMAVPTPGLRGHAALAALLQPQGRVHLAHSDLSAYSVFEEAFTHGARAARHILQADGNPRRMA